MRVAPDRDSAAHDEKRLAHVVRGCLLRALPSASVPAERQMVYPGFHAAAHRLQRLLRRGELGSQARANLAAELRAVAERASNSRARSIRHLWHPWWTVDLAPPEEHLTESLNRAVGQIPEHPDRAVALAVTDWDGEHRQIFRAACETLAQVWPEMLAELSTVVRQVALLDGWGIDGYTDFTVHGGIFVNKARLKGEPDELPVHLRLAEALVHEGTHNRCDAAAASDPFLASARAAAGTSPLLQTPLRADPRPLSGLFQQVIVLARSVLFYDKLPATGPVRARREFLLGQGLQGVATLRSQLTGLTEHGCMVADEAYTLLVRRAETTRTR
jgi:HEXXH motif-containing protein